jgi:hypothetical protein
MRMPASAPRNRRTTLHPQQHGNELHRGSTQGFIPITAPVAAPSCWCHPKETNHESSHTKQPARNRAGNLRNRRILALEHEAREAPADQMFFKSEAHRSVPQPPATVPEPVETFSEQEPAAIREAAPERELPTEPEAVPKPHTMEQWIEYDTYSDETLKKLAENDDALALFITSMKALILTGEYEKGEQRLIHLLHITKNPAYASDAIATLQQNLPSMPLERGYMLAIIAAGLGDAWWLDHGADDWREELGNREPEVRARAEAILESIYAGRQS